jgi:hypothetical protein
MYGADKKRYGGNQQKLDQVAVFFSVSVHYGLVRETGMIKARPQAAVLSGTKQQQLLLLAGNERCLVSCGAGQVLASSFLSGHQAIQAQAAEGDRQYDIAHNKNCDGN